MALMGISEMILVDPDKVELSNLNRQGITSTYVENTEELNHDFNGTKDHLHIRGEYNIINGRI